MMIVLLSETVLDKSIYYKKDHILTQGANSCQYLHNICFGDNSHKAKSKLPIYKVLVARPVLGTLIPASKTMGILSPGHF